MPQLQPHPIPHARLVFITVAPMMSLLRARVVTVAACMMSLLRAHVVTVADDVLMSLFASGCGYSCGMVSLLRGGVVTVAA